MGLPCCQVRPKNRVDKFKNCTKEPSRHSLQLATLSKINLMQIYHKKLILYDNISSNSCSPASISGNIICPTVILLLYTPSGLLLDLSRPWPSHLILICALLHMTWTLVLTENLDQITVIIFIYHTSGFCLVCGYSCRVHSGVEDENNVPWAYSSSYLDPNLQ